MNETKFGNEDQNFKGLYAGFVTSVISLFFMTYSYALMFVIISSIAVIILELICCSKSFENISVQIRSFERYIIFMAFLAVLFSALVRNSVYAYSLLHQTKNMPSNISGMSFKLNFVYILTHFLSPIGGLIGLIIAYFSIKN